MVVIKMKFVCRVCRKRFKTHRSRLSHERMAHGKNPMKNPEIVQKVQNKLLELGIYDNGGQFGRLWRINREEMLRITRRHMVGNSNPMRNPKTAKKVGNTLYIKYLSEPNPTKGMKRSQEYIKKMKEDKERWKKVSETLTGKKHTKEHVQNWKKWSLSEEGLEWRDYLTQSWKGKNNPNWNGGVKDDPYGPEFTEELREYIRNLYGRKCVLCYKTEKENGRRLSVHHKDGNKKNNNVENLIPLCLSCHNSIKVKKEIIVVIGR